MGRTGLKLSVLSIGSWMTYGGYVKDQEEVAFQCIKRAIDGGVNFIDTAESYDGGNAEGVLARALKRGGWARKDLVISTKIFWGGQGPNDRGLSRKHIVEGTLACLKRLELDYVDIVYAHRPDPQTPMEEVVRAFNHVIERGWAFYWGTSEWSAAEIMEAHAVAGRLNLIAPSVEQPEYNLYARDRVEREYAQLYDTVGLGTTIWSPLKYGILSGKYNAGIPADSRMAQQYRMSSILRSQLESAEGEQRLAMCRKFVAVAERLGCTAAQLALAWCVRNRRVTSVITGASRVEQVEENLKALEFVAKIDDAVAKELDDIFGAPKMRQDYRAM